MMERLAEQITARLISAHIIEAEDQEMYQFGVVQLLYQVSFFAFALAAGLLLKVVPETVLFLVAFFSLRPYAGGWHASTQGKCTLISYGIATVALVSFRLMPEAALLPLSIGQILIGTAAIWRWAPMENPSKLLDAAEIAHYRRYARVITGLLAAATVFTVAMQWTRVGYAVSTAVFLCAVLVALGLVQKTRYLSS